MCWRIDWHQAFEYWELGYELPVGQAIILLGKRKDESANRAKSI